MNKASLSLALIMGAGLGMTAPATAETLEDVLSSTYQTNPTLMARRARLRSTDESVPQALSGWRPTVSMNNSIGKANTTAKEKGSPGATVVTVPKSAQLTIKQPVFDGGKTIYGTSQAENTVLAERAGLESAEQSVLLNTASAYLNVVRDEEVVKLSINNEQVLRRQLEATQERFRVGEITRTDVSQAEARLAKAVADRVAATGVLETSRANYVNNVGVPPESPRQPPLPPAMPATLDELVAAALVGPNVQTADYTFRAAKDGVDATFGELLPSVYVAASGTRSSESTTRYSEGRSESVTLNLSIPLYEGGATYARVRAAKHTAGQRRIELDQAKRDATEAAAKAWDSLQSARAQTQAYEAQIKSAELALAGVREESNVGSRTVLDVLNAEQELFDARVNLAKAQHDVLVAAYQVKSAQGQLTAKGLALPVVVYDPVKHYDDVRGQWIGTGIDTQSEYE
jgi:outer membrane protein